MRAARYCSVSPDRFLDLPVRFIMGAIDEADEDRREAYRVAAYPVYLRNAKKGTSWSQFLSALNLGHAGSQDLRKSAKMSKADLDALYARAAAIRAADLGARNV